MHDDVEPWRELVRVVLLLLAITPPYGVTGLNTTTQRRHAVVRRAWRPAAAEAASRRRSFIEVASLSGERRAAEAKAKGIMRKDTPRTIVV